MSQFDMSHQQVDRQYIAGRDMNFGQVQSADDLLALLEELKDHIAQGQKAGIIDEDVATDTQYQVTKAIDQSQKPHPDKKTIIDHLSMAKLLLENISAAGGLVTALAGASQVVQRLFT
ncbi:MAG TPA: hypothetical protein VN207_04645 [Ktedonobacteraceae bacterium]|nr:hypothetical protein [Ktedonobacteraceae bacterium]